MATMPPLTVKCRMLCHCLRVTEDEVRQAVENGVAQSVRDVVLVTQAGSGCNACHHKIRAAIAAHATRQLCSPAPSPENCIASSENLSLTAGS